MIDLSKFVPQFDDTAQALNAGQLISLKFIIPAGEVFIPSSFMYKNTDSIAHTVGLALNYGVSDRATVAERSVPAGVSRQLFPIRTVDSSGGSIMYSTDPMIFCGPVEFLFRVDEAAADAHTPLMFSRWFQAKSTVRVRKIAIGLVVT